MSGYFPERFSIERPPSVRRALSGFKGIDFDGEERGVPCDYAKVAYNCSMENGRLKRCVRAGRGEVATDAGPMDIIPDQPNAPVKSFVYKKATAEGVKLYLLGVNVQGGLHYLLMDENMTGQWKYVRDVLMHGEISGLNYDYNGNDVFLFCSEKDGLFAFDGERLSKLSGAPILSQVCVHADRLFAKKPDDDRTLWFSDDFNPDNWNVSLAEGGYIRMQRDDGEIVKLESFLNSLYIFRRFGIWKLNAYGEQKDFELSRLFVAPGRIYGGTVISTGEKIIFLTDAGLYAFDGYQTVKLCRGLDGFLKSADKAKACAAECAGAYYLALRRGYDDGRSDMDGGLGPKDNNTVVRIDAEGRATIMRGINVLSFMSADNELLKGVYFCQRHSPYALFQMDTYYNDVPFSPMLWRSPEADFGAPDKYKIIKTVGFDANCAFKLTVEADGRKFTFDFEKGEGERTGVDVRGKKFTFSIESADGSADARIDSAFIEADVRSDL